VWQEDTMESVSIIIATYNRSNLLKECLNSLLAQTYPDIEIIVVDDGSTDNTGEAIKEIVHKHKNISYYSRPHLGLSATRNFGLKQSRGEYICFFDSDDLWPANYIETMVGALEANPDFDAAYSRIMILDEGETEGQPVVMDKPPVGHITTELFLRSSPFNYPSSTMLRRKTFDDILWEEAAGNCDDFDVFLRISTKSKFMFVSETCMTYRKTADSITSNAKKKLFTYHMYVMERFYFHLGGDLFVPRREALHKISHLYRSLALKHYRLGNRKASMALLKKALYYLPSDLRLYINLFKAFLLDPQNDKMPDWKLPPALPVKRNYAAEKT
jgi:glycosyltransferase involved in cell wall biosynthesis